MPWQRQRQQQCVDGGCGRPRGCSAAASWGVPARNFHAVQVHNRTICNRHASDDTADGCWRQRDAGAVVVRPVSVWVLSGVGARNAAGRKSTRGPRCVVKVRGCPCRYERVCTAATSPRWLQQRASIVAHRRLRTDG